MRNARIFTHYLRFFPLCFWGHALSNSAKRDFSNDINYLIGAHGKKFTKLYQSRQKSEIKIRKFKIWYSCWEKLLWLFSSFLFKECDYQINFVNSCRYDYFFILSNICSHVQGSFFNHGSKKRERSRVREWASDRVSERERKREREREREREKRRRRRRSSISPQTKSEVNKQTQYKSQC